MKGKETTSAACLRSHWGFLLLRQPPSSAACPSPHWGSLLLRQPHSFQEHTHSSRPGPQPLCPSISLPSPWLLPTIHCHSFLQAVFVVC